MPSTQSSPPGAIQSTTDGRAAPIPAFSGWTMLGVSSIAIYLSGPAQTYGVSTFVDPVLSEFGWSRSLFSTVYSIGTLFSAGVLILIGRQIDRYGNRLIMSISAALFGVALLVLSISSSVISLLIGFALLRSFGSSVLSLSARTLVPRWFERRIGLAFSLIGLASMLSQATVPPFNDWIIGEFGWRAAWRVNAAIIILVLLPIVTLVTRNRPEELGQFPDGAQPTPERAETLRTMYDQGPSLREAARTWPFWGVIGAGAVPALVMTGLAFNQVAIFTDRGLSTSLAASAFAIDAVFAVSAAFLAGWLVGRIPVRYVLGASQGVMVVAIGVLLVTNSPPMAIAYAALRGCSNGLFMVAVDVAWPVYFGRRHLGSIRGFSFAVGSVAAALGPIPFGLSYDYFGGYDAAIGALIVFPLVAAIAVIRSKPPELVVNAG